MRDIITQEVARKHPPLEMDEADRLRPPPALWPFIFVGRILYGAAISPLLPPKEEVASEDIMKDMGGSRSVQAPRENAASPEYLMAFCQMLGEQETDG